MKKFLGSDFLLSSKTAQTLFDNYAKDMPIFDFHCHLNAEDIYADKKFRSITEAWLGGDHYKWRLMREAGIDEGYITGDKSDYEKFLKYAEIMPYAIGSPIFHWTHLELRRYFGIEEILSPKTAKKIYDKANERLETLTARRLIKMSRVTRLFTTDDPVDDLRFHKLLRADETFGVETAPAFRPDKALNIGAAGFPEYIARLSCAAGADIGNIDELCAALSKRMDHFAEAGCVCADHALDEVMFVEADRAEADAALKKALSGGVPESGEIERYKSYVLVFLGRQYAARGWVQQYHIGAMRNNSSRRLGTLGADAGFDAIGDAPVAGKLSALLDALDSTGELPRTILYCLNPRDNEMIAALMNCFQQSGAAGWVQFGAAWWFNDQKDGITRHLTALSQLGLLSRFVGMLTDSRSFLSYTRHEYFRRILCDMIGRIIEDGEYPDDIELAGEIVRDICYNNAVRYFYGE